MARLSQAEMQQAVLDLVNGAPGGVISHNALVAGLEAAGKGDSIKAILPMSQNGQIGASVHHVEGGKPELRYTKVVN